MLGLVGSIIGAATAIFEYLNLKESRKYINKMVEIKKDIMEEEARGYDSDDAKIEALLMELKIIVDAAQTEMNMILAKKTV